MGDEKLDVLLWLGSFMSQQETSWSIPSTLAITLLLAVLAAWVVVRRVTMLDLFEIPTPWGSPVIGLGHLLMMALHVSNGHEQFLKWHDTYGPIVRLRLLHRDVVIVADPQVASELLSKGPNECPRRTPEYTLFNAAHGMPGYAAILTEQNEERWRAIRRAIVPSFTLSAVRDLFPTIVTCYADVCKRINSGISVQHSESSSNSSSRSGDHSSSDMLRSHPASNGRLAASCPASEPDVLIDEEVFAANLRILTDGFLRMPSEGLFDVHRAAADASSLIAITNTFVTQPWKRWLYLGIPGLCKVCSSRSRTTSSCNHSNNKNMSTLPAQNTFTWGHPQPFQLQPQPRVGWLQGRHARLPRAEEAAAPFPSACSNAFLMPFLSHSCVRRSRVRSMRSATT
eukprot:GHRQ01014369.1.p1 GENE.GHRQ01014369.1~~GHRQ01014369.1.p1  ORF type:complete len:398 (+),score=53.30 GHRQ01014369.1:222-1415(+)